ncbi:ComEA family DNA-binding protein [Sandaracinus amylolyticus]|uniref:ComEA family DNA-binding protein n=1 Tax=Sandaracinus amylolyticus TaxID=927083 RepID=UPI001F27A6C4|nr:ComEA family DNA-binding protein [Sandaracinus amylolyticus]
MSTARRPSSSPIAALGVLLVAVALGVLAARHRAERPPAAAVDLAPEPDQERETGPLDLNVADAAALQALPRIGPSLARRIIEDREANGPFTSVDDLDRVRGIGPATIEQLRALVRVGGAATSRE